MVVGVVMVIVAMMVVVMVMVMVMVMMVLVVVMGHDVSLWRGSKCIIVVVTSRASDLSALSHSR